MRPSLLCTMTALVLAFAIHPVQAQDKDLSRLVQGNNEFALHLHSVLAKQPGNLFYSPYSISSALGMTYVGARGATAEEMKAALHFNLDPEKLNLAWGELTRGINQPKKERGYQLSVANRLFGQENYGFLPEFLKITGRDYGASLDEVDFIKNTEGARKIINAWVEKETRDKIKELLKPGVVTVDTRMVLANAIYFKSAWMRNFNEKATKVGQFKLDADKTVKTSLMHGHIRTGLFKGQDFSVLQLPYQNGGLSMFVLLPHAVDGLSKLEKQLTVDNLKKWTTGMGDYLVDITLPKFKITAEFQLNKTLKEMGMAIPFLPGKADFSGMASRGNLFISAVVHKAYVDVHEQGTEAAAATAVLIEATSAPQPATFTADHPFLFLIQERATGSILFMGRLTDPS